MGDAQVGCRLTFLTMPVSLDHPHGPRTLMGTAYAWTRNGTRITTTLFPDHMGRVLAARPVYLATLELADQWGRV